MSRIQLTDTGMDMMMKMSDGNPGALTAIMDIMAKSVDIDPQSALGEISCILSLDTHEIYGSDIYVLWNDKCNREARRVVMLLRAVQLGFMHESKLQSLAGDQSRLISLTDDEELGLDKKVCDALSDFAKAA